MTIYASLQKVPDNLLENISDDYMTKFTAPQGSMNIKNINCKITSQNIKKKLSSQNQECCVELKVNDWSAKTLGKSYITINKGRHYSIIKLLI